MGKKNCTPGFDRAGVVGYFCGMGLRVSWLRFVAGVWLASVVCTAFAGAVDLRILLPLYSYPAWYNEQAYLWDDVAAAGARVPIVAIINPNNGPNGGPPNDDYVHGLADLRAGGVGLLGYVPTGYGKRSADAVKADVKLYDDYFNIDGIFFDEADNTTNHLAYYEDLFAYVRTNTQLGTVILNPGIGTVEEYFSRPACDAAVIFEVNAGWSTYTPAAYVSNYPASRFAVMPYAVPHEAGMRQAVDLAVFRNVGYVYVTDDGGDNPWDSLPTYWTQLVDYVAAWRELGCDMAVTNGVELNLRALPGHSYRVRHKPDLVASGDWTDLAGGTATNARVTVPDPDAPDFGSRYYKVEILP